MVPSTVVRMFRGRRSCEQNYSSQFGYICSNGGIVKESEQDCRNALTVGHRMSDGTLYAGQSPDTGTPMYVRPADERLTMRWNQAMEFARNLRAHGHEPGTFRVPSDSELVVLFQNRAHLGGFSSEVWGNRSRYWSSTEGWSGTDTARDRYFQSGDPLWAAKTGRASVRLVRS